MNLIKSILIVIIFCSSNLIGQTNEIFEISKDRAYFIVDSLLLDSTTRFCHREYRYDDYNNLNIGERDFFIKSISYLRLTTKLPKVTFDTDNYNSPNEFGEFEWYSKVGRTAGTELISVYANEYEASYIMHKLMHKLGKNIYIYHNLPEAGEEYAGPIYIGIIEDQE